ncbi:elongation of very long chain fatty acids protein F-like isoform X2 [Drosophila ficusphila]|uniref:elongation of very long chain fatty acids protein F-like isoform X2 n=1 Tax=Drosophila ficusphila TaxID=30025 RepID=UPI0007E7C637|nr:elongation of very long chain fatty acids protein F-like isoform X2 [Drosophila ficusphila]
MSFFILGPGIYSFKCLENLPLDHEWKNFERWASYAYYFNKYMDLLETFFFVLRKKNQQISFLHVFHHTYMVLFVFAILRYHGYGGFGFCMSIFNVGVHIMMYTYYYQSSLNQNSKKKDLWWKHYITIAQLVQFGVILVYSIYSLSQPECSSTRMWATYTGGSSIIFIILFTNFYYHAYIRTKKKAL